MGYCMSYRRALNRNGLFGSYGEAGWATGNYGDAPMDVAGRPCELAKPAAAGDMRRVEANQRDEYHLAAYARYAGVTEAQVKAVLDALFDGLPDSPFDCICLYRQP